MSAKFTTLACILVAAVSVSFAYINIEQYCKAFDGSFLPMICILKNNGNNLSQIADETILIAEKVIDKVKYKPKPHLRPRPRPRPRPHRPRPRPVFHPRPPPHPVYIKPDYHETEEWEDDEEVDCSCDVNCYPVMANPNPNVTGVAYRCQTCGSSCWVRPTIQSNCSCAVPMSNASCTCVATCASFRDGLGMGWGGVDLSRALTSDPDLEPVPERDKGRMSWGWDSDSDEYEDSASDSVEDRNCIFTIAVNDTRIGEILSPYACSCCKSTEAQRTADSDFVCICQRVSIAEKSLGLVQLPGEERSGDKNGEG